MINNRKKGDNYYFPLCVLAYLDNIDNHQERVTHFKITHQSFKEYSQIPMKMKCLPKVEKL